MLIAPIPERVLERISLVDLAETIASSSPPPPRRWFQPPLPRQPLLRRIARAASKRALRGGRIR